jgi:L-threonylcarbamoyladenylate synthase
MFILNAVMVDTEAQKAGKIILAGGIILYPTDTIWGIGCDATNRESVHQIYHIKQRTDSKSMLVLINGTSMLEDYLDHIPPLALEIIRKAEKPTTIIYPGARHLADNLVAPDGSVGIRITSDPFCRRLIEITGKPIVSTSANISGEESPSAYYKIKTTLMKQVDYVVQWRQDETTDALPSQVIKLEADGTFQTLRS